MSLGYGWIQLVHLAGAIVFAGAVAFEVLILAGLHREPGADATGDLETRIMRRARRVMPPVVLALYASGAWMVAVRCPAFACLDSRFGQLLGLKLLLALAVLGVFVATVVASVRGWLDPCRVRHTHRLVLGLMAGIVFLAKAMFLL